MPKVRNILPKKEHEAGRAMRPFTHSMEEFFENAFPRRWMEGFFEPYALRRPFFTEFKREFEEEETKEEFVRHEMAYGRLYRSVLLPFEVLGDDAKAELKDGVLEIFLPKVEATTPYKVKVA
jgi:hypothetical protein